MKKMIFWAALFWACALVGQEPSVIVFDSVGAYYEPPVLVFGPQDSVFPVGGYATHSYDCKFTRREGPWEAVRQGGRAGCYGAFESYHDWVLAADGDIEQPGPIVTLVYYPCGSPWQTVLGRICSKCGREERRVIYYSYEQVQKPESLFRELQKKFHGSGN